MEPLIQILKRLQDGGLEFVLVGGMAAIVHGSGLVTRDVDIAAVLDDEGIRKIVDALKGLNPRWSQRPDKLIPVDDPEKFKGFRNLYITTDWGTLDVLGEVAGVGTFDDVKKHSAEIDVGGLRCRVLNIETLIASKLAVGREKDRLWVDHLRAIQRTRAARGERQ